MRRAAEDGDGCEGARDLREGERLLLWLLLFLIYLYFLSLFVSLYLSLSLAVFLCLSFACFRSFTRVRNILCAAQTAAQTACRLPCYNILQSRQTDGRDFVLLFFFSALLKTRRPHCWQICSGYLHLFFTTHIRVSFLISMFFFNVFVYLFIILPNQYPKRTMCRAHNARSKRLYTNLSTLIRIR